MKRGSYVAVAVMLFVVGAVGVAWYVWIARGPTIRQLHSAEQKDRPAILAALVEENGLHGFPPEFSLTSKRCKVDSLEVVQARNEVLIFSRAWYPVRERGSGVRGHAFVFDSSGKIIFHCPDNIKVNPTVMPYDITGNGQIELVVEFDRYEVGEIEDSFSSLNNVLQVWTFGPAGPKLLLNVRYESWPEPVKFIQPVLSWPRSNSRGTTIIGRGRPTVALGEPLRETVVEFQWSTEKQEFVTDSPVSDHWAMIYPPLSMP